MTNRTHLKVFNPDPDPSPPNPETMPASEPRPTCGSHDLPPIYEALLDLHQQQLDAIHAATKLIAHCMKRP